MGQHVKDFFSQFCEDTPQGHFHKVTALNDHPEISWEALLHSVPNMCKGWFELSHLSPQDRIEFTCDFWLAKLPYHPTCSEFIEHFFSNLEDIQVYLTQQKFDDPLEAYLVYILKNDSGFFKGKLPISEHELSDLQKAFPDCILPSDYLAFLQIHNGFSKATDCTGIIPSTYMETAYNNFQSLIGMTETITTNDGIVVDQKKLIPFYESFGMPFYQCFWADWYPEEEMGNVYFSGMTMTISDTNGSDPSSDTMAFPTFTDWLMFYMETII